MRGPTPSPDTLIAFYASNVSYGNILVRFIHTDVLAILVMFTHTDVLAIRLGRRSSCHFLVSACCTISKPPSSTRQGGRPSCMSGGNEKERLTRIKKIYSVSLPYAHIFFPITPKGPTVQGSGRGPTRQT